MKKGLTRLIFIVIFLIPVAWYLVLQLLGDNRFSLELVGTVDATCGVVSEVSIYSKKEVLSIVETNYMNRVVYGADKRKTNLVNKEQSFFDCINQSESDLVLISKEGIWGTYMLTRDGVDQLLTELDILMLQQSYGKGTSR